MILKQLLTNLSVTEVIGSTDIEISDLQFDSRKVSVGSVFVAQEGTVVDGHRFIDDCIDHGAVAIVCSHADAIHRTGATIVVVDDTNYALGIMACNFYGNPSHHLRLVGVTGTNGKTTIATLLHHLTMRLGHKAGLLSTVCNYVGDETSAATHTTPDSLLLNQLLRRMVDAGCTYAFMEVSSHAIAQQRIAGLDFDGAVFTNLTRDHIDYHKTFENYRDAKKAFFDSLEKDAFAITNADDKNGQFMVQNTKAEVKTYSTRMMADFKAKIIECHFEGMYLDINGREVGVQFIGKFNVSNLLAVYGVAVMLGKKPEEILIILSTLKSVNGRLEPIHSPEGYTAIVDYAHTPDALENVLNAIHEVLDGKGKVITVCGAGGNRDKGKRPLMAQEAVKQSDKVIITSDNPRFEEPQDIINDMLAGLDTKQMKKVLSIVDRKEAIRTACMLAQKGDVILIAGKGHEDYQEIKGVKHHFDDKEIVSEIFGISDK